jgi:integrase
MAEFYENLAPDQADSKPCLRRGDGYISLLELAVRFLKWNQGNKAEGTWRTYRDGLKYVTRKHKSKLAAELTPADVEEVKAEMIKAGFAARTINIMVTAIKRLYNWGCKQGVVTDNPVDGVEHVSRHVNAPKRPKDKHLTLEKAVECTEILRKSPSMGDLCELLLLTGMRVGEVVRVKWEDIDFEQRMLRLEQHKTSARSGRPRTVPLCSRAMEILRSQARDDLQADETVFRGGNDQALTVSALHRRLQALRRKHPELDVFSFHRLRHTCATYLAREKVPERVAQAILGHSSTLMTRYYTATDPQEMIDAVEKLSAAAHSNAAPVAVSSKSAPPVSPRVAENAA